MNKENKKLRRQRRIRAKIKGTAKVPRLSVHRSNKSVYAQLIDDVSEKTILGVSEKHLEKKETTKQDMAKSLGAFLAKKALEKKIKTVVFDKGSYKYHGRVKALAQGAREGGLLF